MGLKGKVIANVYQDEGEWYIDFTDGTHAHLYTGEDRETICDVYPFPSHMGQEVAAGLDNE